MAKKLLIMRHAHAEDYAESGRDFDRQLTSKGESQVTEMAKQLLLTDFRPQGIYSSPALRAKKTAEIWASHLAYPTEKIQFVEGIYEANLYNLVGIINRFDNQFESVAVFGHNPAFTYLADYLGNQPIDGLAKAGMVLIHFENMDWASITQGSGITQWIKTPKEHYMFG
jgi:phosphohistidine phosphatase